MLIIIQVPPGYQNLARKWDEDLPKNLTYILGSHIEI